MPYSARELTDCSIDRLAKLLTILESTDSASDAIGQDKVGCDVSPTRREIENLSWSLGRRAKWVLEQIPQLIQTILQDVGTSENTDAESWCMRALQVVRSYDNTRQNFTWIYQSEATLLRRLVFMYQPRGLWAEIYRILRQLSQISGITLSGDEQRLLAQAYRETFSNAKPLLKQDRILPDDDSKTFQSEHPFPAIHRAIEDGQIEVIPLLLKEGMSPSPPLDIIKRHALHVAAASVPLEMLHCVLKHTRRNTDLRDIFQRTPLFYAARDGCLENFQALVHVGAKMEDRDMFSLSILATAAGSGKADIVDYLLQNKIDPNHQPFGRMTPLMKAAEGGHLRVVKLLLDNRARPDESLASGKNAATIAREKGNTECSSFIDNYHCYTTSSVEQSLIGNTRHPSSQDTFFSRELPTESLEENDQRGFFTDLGVSPVAPMASSAYDHHLPTDAWADSQLFQAAELANNPWPNQFSRF